MRYVVVLAIVCAGCAARDEVPPVAPSIGVIDGEPVARAELVEAMLAEHGETSFARFAERRLVEKAAAAAGVEVVPAEVEAAADAEIAKLAARRFGGDRAKLAANLGRYGQSFERWRASRVADARVLALARGTLARTVDETRVRALFEQRYGKGGIKRQIQHVLISTNVNASRLYTREDYEAEREQVAKEAREGAFDLRRRLLGGADFAALAKAHSDDASAAEGGALGAQWSGRYGPRFDAAVRELQPGRLSPVIEGREGFHVIRVDGFRKGARYTGRALLVSARVRSPNEADGEAARFAKALAKAAALRARVEGGEDFAAVARKESDDPNTAARGGDLGVFGPGRLGREADAVLETIPLQAVSKPLRTPDGYALVQLSSREFVPALDKRLVRHVLVATTYSAVKARRLRDVLPQRAREKAEAILAEAKGGADFATLARTHSEDELSRRTGGSLSGSRVDQMGPEVIAALEGMKPGEVQLVEGAAGLHVIRLEAALEADYGKVREALAKEIRNKPVSDNDVRDWIRGLRARAKIEYRP